MPLYIGTQTREASRGIYRVMLDTDAGVLQEPELVAEADGPSFLAWHPGGGFLYAVNELRTFQGEPGGGVSAFAHDSESDGLRALNAQGVGSGGPCHLALDASGSLLVTANYGGGSIAYFPVGADGSIGPRAGLFTHEGSGPHERRQTRPHAHGITFSPDNRFVLVPDLGIDRVMIYRVDGQSLSLHESESAGVLHSGAGPRHAVFSPDGKHLYVINELDNTVTLFDWDAATGALLSRERYSLLPEGAEPLGTGAELALDPTGRFLYASTRGHDLIAVFARDGAGGELTAVGHFPTEGEGPRTFALSADGQWLVVANQMGGNLVLYRVDAASGLLTRSGEPVSVSLPVCVVFAP